jgi:hypothetical protein
LTASSTCAASVGFSVSFIVSSVFFLGGRRPVENGRRDP